MDSITTLIVEDEPMLAEILVDNIKQFPQFDVIGIADKLESARKQLRLYQPQLISCWIIFYPTAKVSI